MTQLPPNNSINQLILQISNPSGFKTVLNNQYFQLLIEKLRLIPAFEHKSLIIEGNAISPKATALFRKLKTAYAMPARQFFSLLYELITVLEINESKNWQSLAFEVSQHEEGTLSMAKLMLKYSNNDTLASHLESLETKDPHAIYPTSTYRTSSGTVNSDTDGGYIEAVMTTSTMTEIHIAEGVLQYENPILKNLYKPLGRCVCVLDSNVSDHYGSDIKDYFGHHGIKLDLLVYRAMEVDKGIHMVESLMADFKKIGVSRQEPVLIVGGGVIADTGGLACSLYHRNTPYVMLATSIVSGIDAGPSPRTCCDGFGFKNLFGAYHAPVMTLTDRTFFKTLKSGWIRHGVAEIIKMAVVKDLELFELLEDTGIDLLHSQFGTKGDDKELSDKGQRVLTLAMKSYVEAEYGNLYETHQCRPHAYGHTWSPGYEIPSGMLHGHAVACGMGLGAFMSFRKGWITVTERDRILNLISNFELSLWSPILDDTDLIWEAQVKVTQKRGGNLVAPLPKGSIGKCGYLNDLSKSELETILFEYKTVCVSYPQSGIGVEPLCSDVGLEDPSTIAENPLESHGV